MELYCYEHYNFNSYENGGDINARNDSERARAVGFNYIYY